MKDKEKRLSHWKIRKASQGKMGKMIHKIGMREGNYLNCQKKRNNLSIGNSWRKWKGGRL